jgi:hypothetical protein
MTHKALQFAKFETKGIGLLIQPPSFNNELENSPQLSVNIFIFALQKLKIFVYI